MKFVHIQNSCQKSQTFCFLFFSLSLFPSLILSFSTLCLFLSFSFLFLLYGLSSTVFALFISLYTVSIPYSVSVFAPTSVSDFLPSLLILTHSLSPPLSFPVTVPFSICPSLFLFLSLSANLAFFQVGCVLIPISVSISLIPYQSISIYISAVLSFSIHLTHSLLFPLFVGFSLFLFYFCFILVFLSRFSVSSFLSILSLSLYLSLCLYLPLYLNLIFFVSSQSLTLSFSTSVISCHCPFLYLSISVLVSFSCLQSSVFPGRLCPGSYFCQCLFDFSTIYLHIFRSAFLTLSRPLSPSFVLPFLSAPLFPFSLLTISLSLSDLCLPLPGYLSICINPCTLEFSMSLCCPFSNFHSPVLVLRFSSLWFPSRFFFAYFISLCQLLLLTFYLRFAFPPLLL